MGELTGGKNFVMDKFALEVAFFVAKRILKAKIWHLDFTLHCNMSQLKRKRVNEMQGEKDSRERHARGKVAQS